MKFTRYAFAALIGIFSSQAGAEDYPEMTLKYSSNIPEVVNTSKIDTYFSSELEKRSGGNIKVQHFWANALGGEAEIVDLTGAGAIDLALIVTGNQYSRMPFAALTNSLPLTFFDGPKLIKLTRDIFDSNPEIKAELAAANLQPLLYRYLPDYRIYCNTPIKTMEDFQGKKMRSYGAYVPAMFEALGAVPVNIPPTDMIQALKTGALDCTYMFNSAAPMFKIDQATKYDTDLSFGVINAHTLFTSKDNWDHKWPDSVKKLITEVAADAEAYGNKLIADDEAAAVGKLEASGLQVIHFEEPEKFQATVPDMLGLWVGKMEELGKGEEAHKLADYIKSNM